MRNANEGDATWLASEEIQSGAEAMMAELGITQDVTLQEMIELVSQRVGKPIRVLALGNDEWNILTGCMLDFGEFFGILIRSNDAAFYQIHNIAHELAHMLWGHPAVKWEAPDASGPNAYQGTVIHARAMHRPDGKSLSRENMIREGEAEALAHLLAQALLRPKYVADERIFG
ncbi:hypothetical protein [Rathayibacter rathayi]|uniref:hypothetical protein n=1 Tax=Rathayibacter rathayi TaxID=33887 RepID=UPI0011B0A448|nr:hypothetical protein [Rathayibacter rathayi]